MKKASAKRAARNVVPDADEILPEYDFRRAKPNPYASRIKGDAIRVILDPDVAVHFPTSVHVNRALREFVAADGGIGSRRGRVNTRALKLKGSP